MTPGTGALKTTSPVNTLWVFSPHMYSHLLTHATFRCSTAYSCLAQSKPNAVNIALAMAFTALVLQRENKQLFLVPECRICTKLEMPQKWGVSVNKERFFLKSQHLSPHPLPKHYCQHTGKKKGKILSVLLLPILSDLLITNGILIVHSKLFILSQSPS